MRGFRAPRRSRSTKNTEGLFPYILGSPSPRVNLSKKSLHKDYKECISSVVSLKSGKRGVLACIIAKNNYLINNGLTQFLARIRAFIKCDVGSIDIKSYSHKRLTLA